MVQSVGDLPRDVDEMEEAVGVARELEVFVGRWTRGRLSGCSYRILGRVSRWGQGSTAVRVPRIPAEAWPGTLQ